MPFLICQTFRFFVPRNEKPSVFSWAVWHRVTTVLGEPGLWTMQVKFMSKAHYIFAFYFCWVPYFLNHTQIPLSYESIVAKVFKSFVFCLFTVSSNNTCECSWNAFCLTGLTAREAWTSLLSGIYWPIIKQIFNFMWEMNLFGKKGKKKPVNMTFQYCATETNRTVSGVWAINSSPSVLRIDHNCG